MCGVNNPTFFFVILHKFGRAPTNVRRANFHYTIPPAFCQEKSCTNVEKIKIPILCFLPIAIWCGVWYTIIVTGRGSKPVHGVGLDLRVGIGIDPQKCTLPTSEKISEISEKPLDKPLKMWYNVRAVERKSSQGTPRWVMGYTE